VKPTNRAHWCPFLLPVDEIREFWLYLSDIARESSLFKKTLLDKKLLKQVKKNTVSAKAVIISKGKVLLLKQSNGHWDLPGGKLDNKENIVDGLIREVEEETGIKVWPMKYLVSKTRRVKNNQDLLIVTFLCSTIKPVKKKHIQLSAEHHKFTFVDIPKALGLDLRNRHKEAIKAAEKYLSELAEAVS
jgi:8-oxo-dGTP diphosphatase